MRFKDVLDILFELADKNVNIKGFYTSLNYQHNDSTIIYPSMRVLFPYSVSTQEQGLYNIYNIDMTLLVNSTQVRFDIMNANINTNFNVQQNTLNEIEDGELVDENIMREFALKIMMQYVSGIKQLENDYDYFVLQSYKIESLERYCNDSVTGVKLSISIKTNNEYNCQSIENFNDSVWKSSN